MKYILCQPATKRFQWELDVVMTNLKELGVSDVVLLFAEYDNSLPFYFQDKYDAEVFVYPDNREDKRYIPSIKPYLWWKFLEENPQRQADTYFYIDADVIFRELLDFTKLPVREDLWFASDCSGYLNINYIKGCDNGEKIAKEMAEIIGVSTKDIEAINDKSGGAQWIIKNPSIQYWEKVYNDSNKLWDYFSNLDTNLQTWTAEMWAQLWNMIYFNIGCEVSKEMEFCWATDTVDRWYETKIMHNAGVTSDETLFFKGKFVDISPLDVDLSYVDKDFVSYKYVEAILKTK